MENYTEEQMRSMIIVARSYHAILGWQHLFETGWGRVVGRSSVFPETPEQIAETARNINRGIEMYLEHTPESVREALIPYSECEILQQKLCLIVERKAVGKNWRELGFAELKDE